MCLLNAPHCLDLLRLVLLSHFLRLADTDSRPQSRAYGEDQAHGCEDNKSELLLAHLFLEINFLPENSPGDRDRNDYAHFNELNDKSKCEVSPIATIVRRDYLKKKQNNKR